MELFLKKHQYIITLSFHEDYCV